MSGRGIDFLENWVNKNVTSADRKGIQDRATGLAAQCHQKAAAVGEAIMAIRFASGIWRATTFNYQMNFPVILTVVTAMVALTAIAERFDLGTGGTVTTIFWIVVAMSVHATILKNQPGFAIHKDGKEFVPFMWRAFVLVGLGLVGLIPFLVIVMPLLNNLNRELWIIPFLAIYGIVETFILSLWGTCLPAVIVHSDASFATAWQRGKKTFGYVFVRLLFLAGLGYTITFAGLALFITIALSDMTYWTKDGGLYFSNILAQLIFTLAFAYQIVMVATVLSRAFLIAESPDTNQGPSR